MGCHVASFEVAGYRPRNDNLYVAHTAPGRYVARFPAVSYTHLDVYKRQVRLRSFGRLRAVRGSRRDTVDQHLERQQKALFEAVIEES